MITRLMYIFKFIIISFFLFHSFTYASNLKIEGLSKLSFDDIQALTNTDIKKSSLTENDINKIIFDLYKSELIYDVKFERNENLFRLIIEENKLIENIYINGNVRVKDDLILQNITLNKNNFLNKNFIKNDIDLIKNIYVSKGFNNVNVVVSTEKFSQDRVNLIYNVSEGKISKISKINFNGNDNFSDKYLSSIINSRSLNFYNLFSSGSNFDTDNFIFDLSKINSFYKDKGFFNIKTSYELSLLSYNSYILTFYIDEGKRTVIDDVFLDEKSYSDDESLYNFKVKFLKKLNKNKNFYDKFLIDEFLENLNSYLVKNNNYNSIYQSNIINENGKNLLKVFEKRVKPEVINSVSIYGNDITKDKTIRSKLGFQPGDYFNQNIVDISKKNLLRYKYINNIDISKNPNQQGSTDLVIDVDENKKTGQIMAAGTFSGDVGAGLSLGLKDNNLLGSGNNLDLNFLINDEKTRFKISLTHYPITSSKISNRYTIFNTESDLKNSFGFKSEEQGASYSLNFEYDEKIDISTGFGYKKSNRYSPTKNTLAINDNIGKFDIYTIDLSLIYDTTNDFLYPTDGSLNSLYIEYAPKDISDDSYYKILLRSDLYRQSKKSNRFIFFSNDIGFAESSENKLKTTYAYSLGGLNFKGFDYRGIGPKTDDIYLGGNKFFTSTIGIGGTFLFDQKDNISTKLFHTLGSLWDSDYTTKNEFDLRSSVGISFDILTAIGPISFSYAIPLEKDNEDRSREFNFTIGTSF